MPWVIVDKNNNVQESYMDVHGAYAARKLKEPEHNDHLLRYSPVTYTVIGLSTSNNSIFPVGTIYEGSSHTDRRAAEKALETYRRGQIDPLGRKGSELWLFWIEEKSEDVS